jgi:hypothetical protein
MISLYKAKCDASEEKRKDFASSLQEKGNVEEEISS